MTEEKKKKAVTKKPHANKGRKKPAGSGRQKHRATAERKKQVATLIAFGTTQGTVAEILGISHVTLTKYYHKELETAKAKAVSTVAGKVYEQAVNGCRASQKLYLSTIGGWKSAPEIENNISVTNTQTTKDAELFDKPFTDLKTAAQKYDEMVAGLPKLKH